MLMPLLLPQVDGDNLLYCCNSKDAKVCFPPDVPLLQVDGDNLLYCCTVKDDAHVWDPACSVAGFCSSDFYSLPK